MKVGFAKRRPKDDNDKKQTCPNCFHASLARLADAFCPKKVSIKWYVQNGEIEKLTMLTGCINGMKGEENRHFTLKTSKLTAYLPPFMLSFTWVCSVKALLLSANLNAFTRKNVSKRIEKSEISRNKMTYNPLQNIFIFPVFTTSRVVVRKYAKGEEVFVKKKDN